MIDSHLHLDDPRYDPDRDELIARARAVGIEAFLLPGVQAAQWPALPALAARHGAVFALGTHPRALPQAQTLPTELAGAVAIGECGLDGQVPVAMELQEAVLRAHVELAREAGLPLILHCYKAHDRLRPLLRRYAPLRGVLHSYSGGPELVADYLELGLHFSFAGTLTWENARKPLNALRRVPTERLLVETDGPDQCPRPHRGRNEPAFLVHVLAKMEEVRGEALAGRLAANTRELFGLAPPA